MLRLGRTQSALLSGRKRRETEGPADQTWATRDSNPDGLPHTPLKRARLPVPPAARLSRLILPVGSPVRHREQGVDRGPVA